MCAPKCFQFLTLFLICVWNLKFLGMKAFFTPIITAGPFRIAGGPFLFFHFNAIKLSKIKINKNRLHIWNLREISHWSMFLFFEKNIFLYLFFHVLVFVAAWDTGFEREIEKKRVSDLNRQNLFLPFKFTVNFSKIYHVRFS